MRLFFAGLLLPFVLTGCATHWTHPTKTEAEFRRDSDTCWDGALREVVKEAPSPLPPEYQTDCSSIGNNVSCTTKQVQRNGDPDPWGIGLSMNRQRYKERCLRQMGYTEMKK